MRKTDTKERIIATALKQFASEGFAAASIRKMAKEVGIRESAFYNHFSSKDEILKEIFARFGTKGKIAALLSDELLEQIDKPKKFLTLFVEKLFSAWEEENEKLFFNLLTKEATSKRENSFTLFDEINEMESVWRFVFEQMIKFKTIKKHEPETLANEFSAPLFFFRIKYFATEDSRARKKIKKEIAKHIEFFVDSIAG